MAGRSGRRFSYGDAKTNSPSDDPPNSRLFIIGSKQLAEDDFRSAFSKFGNIEEIWVVKDRNTGEPKGVTYIKYSKTSEAANAMEAMSGRVIGGSNQAIKVMIAASREQGSKRDGNEDEKTQRLFVIVPKTMTNDELFNYFKAFGEIDYATIIKDKDTRESKGFAYVKYFKFSHAAVAFEQCDRKYKAVFAEPRKPKQVDNFEKSYSSNNYEGYGKSNYGSSLLPLPDSHNSDGFTRLQVIASPMLNEDQLWKLFDLVPGMDYCHLRYEGRPRPVRALATVVYTNSEAATYAREKLHGFEYPIGHRLIVKADMETARSFNDSQRSPLLPVSRSSGTSRPDILHLAETIAHATSLIQAAGLSPDVLHLGLGDSHKKESFCNVDLPDPKPLLNIDAETAERCFIVCSPQPPPPSVLRDVFCRFGSLIDVYMLTNRNVGYAKYGTRESAQNAMKTLHGAEICGIRIKVIKAEERDNSRKRLRLDDEN